MSQQDASTASPCRVGNCFAFRAFFANETACVGTYFKGRADHPRETGPKRLIIFLNGLSYPATSWNACISLLMSYYLGGPPMFTYDRYGQGFTTDRDPRDSDSGTHDLLDVVKDLHTIVYTIAGSRWLFSQQDVNSGKLNLLLVGQSIGGPLARLYAQHHPGIVAGIIMLDSNIAHMNYSDMSPDPDLPNFDPEAVLDEDCPTVEVYRQAREALARRFNLDVPNGESLDRTTGPKLLPFADSPKLIGPGGKRGPFVSVVGHDPETFAQGSYQHMATPTSFTKKFTQPHWAAYNEGLTKITNEEKCDGVVIAKGCGHFIQRDDPDFVFREIVKMLRKLNW